MRKRSWWLLCFNSDVTVCVLCLFSMVQWAGLQSVTFPGHTKVLIKMRKHHAREPLYSNSAVIARWLQSTSAHNGVPSCL